MASGGEPLAQLGDAFQRRNGENSVTNSYLMKGDVRSVVGAVLFASSFIALDGLTSINPASAAGYIQLECKITST